MIQPGCRWPWLLRSWTFRPAVEFASIRLDFFRLTSPGLPDRWLAGTLVRPSAFHTWSFSAIVVCYSAGVQYCVCLPGLPWQRIDNDDNDKDNAYTHHICTRTHPTFVMNLYKFTPIGAQLIALILPFIHNIHRDWAHKVWLQDALYNAVWQRYDLFKVSSPSSSKTNVMVTLIVYQELITRCLLMHTLTLCAEQLIVTPGLYVTSGKGRSPSLPQPWRFRSSAFD